MSKQGSDFFKRLRSRSLYRARECTKKEPVKNEEGIKALYVFVGTVANILDSTVVQSIFFNGEEKNIVVKNDIISTVVVINGKTKLEPLNGVFEANELKSIVNTTETKVVVANGKIVKQDIEGLIYGSRKEEPLIELKKPHELGIRLENNGHIIGHDVNGKGIIIVKENSIIKVVKNGEVLKVARTSKSTIDNLEEKIKNKVNFRLTIEDIDEENIKKQLNGIIKKDKEATIKINNELDVLEKKAHDARTEKEIQTIIERVNTIKKQLEILKHHQKIISEYYDFKGYEELKNTSLINSIEDYCFYHSGKDIDLLVKSCKNEVKRLDNIIDTTAKYIGTANKAVERSKEIKKRDAEYRSANSNIDLMTKGFNKIKENIDEQKSYIEDIKNDVIALDVKFKEKALFDNSRSLFWNMFNIGLSFKLMPVLPSFGLLLKVILLKNSISAIRNIINPSIQAKQMTDDIIRKYLNLIDDKKSLLNGIIEMIDESYSDVIDLKNDYINKFSQYSDIFPEYNKYLKKIEELVISLDEKKTALINVQEQLNNSKAKVLKLES